MESPQSSPLPTDDKEEELQAQPLADLNGIAPAEKQLDKGAASHEEMKANPTDEVELENDVAHSHDDVNCDEEEPPEEESVLTDPIPNRVIVARNHPLSYYADRARRILRMEEQLFVLGRGNTISMACTLVEVLKRQRIAVVEKLSTGMSVEPFFNSAGDPQWTQPMSMITFRLKRGDFAEYVTDYQQRKVVEIFEKYDREQTGLLSVDAVEAMDMANSFFSGPERAEVAQAYLAEQETEKINLPTFIKYASILIHPLLRDKIFKKVLAAKYGVALTTDASQLGSPLNSP